MHISKLCLNPKNKRVVKEVANIYQLHKTLLTAFPHADEGGPGRVLYRVDTHPQTGYPEILVQSTTTPDWATLNVDDKYLTAPIESKEFDPSFKNGNLFHFRLLANPTVKREGKRFGLLTDEEQLTWLNRKGENGGFNIHQVRIVPLGFVSGQRPDGKMTFHGVRFEGTLQVTDSEQLVNTLEKGIGSGKGFGFGLLSLAPVRG